MGCCQRVRLAFALDIWSFELTPIRPEKPLDWIGKFLLARSGVVETHISDEDAEGEPDDEWLSGGGGEDQGFGTHFESGMGSYAMQDEMGQ